MNSKKHKLPRRILAMLLAICMFVTMFPSAMFAVGGSEAGGSTNTTYTDKDTATEATGVTANKTLKENDDGTYTINLSVEGFTDPSYETKNLPADIVLVVDTSTSMDEGVVYCQSTSFTKDSQWFRTVYICDECGAEHWQNRQPRRCEATLQNRLDVAKEAAKNFVTGLMDASDQVKIGLYDFSGSNRTDVALTDNEATLLSKIEGLYMPSRGDGTDYGVGLDGAQNILASSEDGREKFVVFISDGQPNERI